MRRIKIDATQEKLLLTGLIVSDKIAMKLALKLDISLLKAKQSKRIAKWAVDYFKEHKKAPGVHIQDIFNAAVEAEEVQPEDAEIIGRTLDRISREFKRAKKFNDQYVLKEITNYLNTQRMKKLTAEMEHLLENDPDAAFELAKKAERITFDLSGIISLNKMAERAKELLYEEKQTLFKVPGAFGELINNDLKRGSFIGFMGHEKIGKTWNLSEFANRAWMQGLNVLYVDAGDMTEDQHIRRFFIRTTNLTDLDRFCGPQLIPVLDCVHNQTGDCELPHRRGEVDLHVADYDDFVNQILPEEEDGNWFRTKNEFWRDAKVRGYVNCAQCLRHKKYRQKFKGAVWYRKVNVQKYTHQIIDEKLEQTRIKIGRKRNLDLACFPARSLTPDILDNLLEDYATGHDGLVPDVVIVDYADLMIPRNNDDYRHRVNDVWLGLRGISQKYNNLVLTATQADAKAFNTETLNEMNFSEDKRKYAHVTSFYTINQTRKEKYLGIIRMGKLMAREDDFDSRKTVRVLQHIATGQPFIASYF